MEPAAICQWVSFLLHSGASGGEGAWSGAAPLLLPPPPPPCPPQEPTPLAPLAPYHPKLVGSLRLNISHRSFASTENRTHRICAPSLPRLVGLRARKKKVDLPPPLYLFGDCAPFSVVSASFSPPFHTIFSPADSTVTWGVRVVRSPLWIVFGEVPQRSHPHGASEGCTNSWFTQRGKQVTRQGM